MNKEIRKKYEKALNSAWLEIEERLDEVIKIAKNEQNYLICLLANMVLGIYRVKNGRELEDE